MSLVETIFFIYNPDDLPRRGTERYETCIVVIIQCYS
jgi:hypothetical protein